MSSPSHFRQRIVASVLVAIAACAVTCAAQDFQWKWREVQELGPEYLLRKSDLPEQDRRWLAKRIAELTRPYMDVLAIGSEQQLRQAALNARIKKVALDGHGLAELIAQGPASPVGNGSIWIFQRMGGAYKLILDGYGQTFTIQPTRTNGYADIVLASHGSANSNDLAVYKFKDGKYEQAACYEAEWYVIEGGKVRDLKEPRFVPCR
jgi:hypothetical protein